VPVRAAFDERALRIICASKNKKAIDLINCPFFLL